MGSNGGGGGRDGRSGGGGGGNPLDLSATTLHGILSSEYANKGIDIRYGGERGTVFMQGKGGLSEKLMISTSANNPSGQTIIQGGKKYSYTSEGLIGALKAFEKGNRI